MSLGITGSLAAAAAGTDLARVEGLQDALQARTAVGRPPLATPGAGLAHVDIDPSVSHLAEAPAPCPGTAGGSPPRSPARVRARSRAGQSAQRPAPPAPSRRRGRARSRRGGCCSASGSYREPPA